MARFGPAPARGETSDTSGVTDQTPVCLRVTHFVLSHYAIGSRNERQITGRRVIL